MKNCPQCKGELVKENTTYDFDYNRSGISVTIKADYCKKCNEFYFTSPQSAVISFASKEAKK